MTPQHQTILGDGTGNCWATCIACLLDMSVLDVPNFCGNPPNNEEWYEQTDKWLQQFGYRVIGISFNKESPNEFKDTITLQVGAYLIATGKSPRGNFLHSVVVQYAGNNKWDIVCDPHPDNCGLDGIWHGIDMIVVSSLGKGSA